MNPDMDFTASFLTDNQNTSRAVRGFSREKVIPLNPNKNVMSTMWEIRIKGSLRNDIIHNSNREEDSILMRNVMTGLYLHFDEEMGLNLRDFNALEEISEGFFFHLKMKNNWTSDNSIK